MKYFFLTEGWVVGRVWEVGGLWNEKAWRRKPKIEQLNVCMWENTEKLWLYRVEEDILMIEVMPGSGIEAGAIGQVVLKRLIAAEQVIELLALNSTK
jgi:hypothetical protein